MFWFKNLMAYRLTSSVDFSNLEEQLKQTEFTPCSKLDMSKFGWAPPLSTSDSLCFRQGSNILLLSHKEEKILPSHVINKHANARIKDLEDKEQRKLKKAEKQAIKDDAIQELLIHAFSKDTFTAVWIDEANQRIYVDSSSAKRSEDTLALLRKTLGSLPVVPLSFVNDASSIMCTWLELAPEWLTVLEEVEFVGTVEHGVAKLKHQDMYSDEICALLEAGKVVTKLALEWEDHLSFRLHEDGTLTRIKFADDILERNDDILKEDIAQRFDSDFLLMTSELTNLMKNLISEFGGERERV